MKIVGFRCRISVRLSEYYLWLEPYFGYTISDNASSS